MNVLYAPPESFIGRLANNLYENEGRHPIAVDFTEDEYAQLKEEAGCPPHLQIPALLGIRVTVEGKPAEQTGSGIIT